jgi:hypothetical protein
MIRRKRITVLGVSLLAALGLMSVSAAGAQAGQWTIDGKAITGGYEPFELQGGPVSITSTGITIPCSEIVGGGYLTTGGVGTSTWITLADCTVEEFEEACLIPENPTFVGESNPTAKLNASGSQLTFSLRGILKMDDGEEECPLISGGERSIEMAGNISANVGSAAVQLGLNFIASWESYFTINAWGGMAELNGETSMFLTGANAGKVLGTTSS